MKIRKIKSLTRDKINYSSRKNYLRLDKNERVNSFDEKLFKKIKISSFDLTAYPETGKIYKYLSNYLKTPKEQLILIPGSDFGLRICFEYFCNNNKKKIITLDPTFGMVEVYSKLYNLKQVKIGYNSFFELEYNQLLKNINSKISLIVLANPNSPTGTVLDKKYIYKIISVANKYKVPVVIDEAYFGFYKYSYLKSIKKFQNLIILRTFSKAFGLAGLRAGYLISNKKIIQELQKFRPMYEINSIACKFLEFLLKNKSFPRNYIRETNKGKKFFEKELSKLKIVFLKSYANFIHIKLGQKKNNIEKALKDKKILTRKGPGVKGFEDFLRITLGPKKEMDKVVEVLKRFF
jgi:histidinol-phosphate aminotransferase